MYQLTNKQAQHIVDKMMADIPYNINIMNEKGIIIGSGSKDRIGTFHTGAVQALRLGRMITITEDNRYEKKGTNEPIVINQKMVGVIGISGEPGEVIPFCKLVKTTVSLLIEQEIALKSMEEISKKKSAFLKLLVETKYQYSDEIKREALNYQLDLTRKTSVLIAKPKPSPKRINYPVFEEDEHSIILLQDNSGVKPLADLLTNENSTIKISVGSHVDTISESYHQAISAMQISEKLNLQKRVIHYMVVSFLSRISEIGIDSFINHSYIKGSLISSPELLETLQIYINKNGNMTLTSKELHIHRNTLQYRLDKIKEITSKDPKQIFELFELIFIMLKD
ncbi:sugar diacid utilization regulator [Pradoshia sp. D12]|uniref:CdaR family transcriptional regulator n=1 Tax=Bacillaceae TaxID=186817 RepID=UPI0011278CDA|nr:MULTISPECIES: sugar diacid recognition domain-containing protein [Bacillaceae]QFK73098.1 sugar diacid utilization regulator [Pradoshia sp. D12]TPF72090.1 sugar diacid utilization regulator [Bacillus sp. D12]